MLKIYLIFFVILLSANIRAGRLFADQINGGCFDLSPQDTVKASTSKPVNYHALSDTAFAALMKEAADAFKSKLQEKAKSLKNQKAKYYLSAENTSGVQAGRNFGRDTRALNTANIEGGINFLAIPLVLNIPITTHNCLGQGTLTICSG